MMIFSRIQQFFSQFLWFETGKRNAMPPLILINKKEAHKPKPSAKQTPFFSHRTHLGPVLEQAANSVEHYCQHQQSGQGGTIGAEKELNHPRQKWIAGSADQKCRQPSKKQHWHTHSQQNRYLPSTPVTEYAQ